MSFFADDCKDKSPLCTIFVKDGDCSAIPDNLLDQCAKSCGACGGKSLFISVNFGPVPVEKLQSNFTPALINI